MQNLKSVTELQSLIPAQYICFDIDSTILLAETLTKRIILTKNEFFKCSKNEIILAFNSHWYQVDVCFVGSKRNQRNAAKVVNTLIWLCGCAVTYGA